MIETRFKDTDVGKIPVDWEVKQLADIGSFSKGCGISRADAITGAIPAVRYGELYTIHDFYIKEFGSFISQAIAQSSRRLRKGDILFTASGETKEDIGKSTAFNQDCDAYAGGDLIILTPRDGYNSIFLGLITNSDKSREQKASKGVFVMTSTFTKGAIESVNKATSKIVLIDGKALAKYMIEYNVGVSTKKVYAIKKIDTDYFDE